MSKKARALILVAALMTVLALPASADDGSFDIGEVWQTLWSSVVEAVGGVDDTSGTDSEPAGEEDGEDLPNVVPVIDPNG